MPNGKDKKISDSFGPRLVEKVNKLVDDGHDREEAEMYVELSRRSVLIHGMQSAPEFNDWSTGDLNKLFNRPSLFANVPSEVSDDI